MDVSALPSVPRFALAMLQDTARRFDDSRGRPDADPVAALREISSDPLLLGLAVEALTTRDDACARGAVDLLMAAGADVRLAAPRARDVRAWDRQPRRPSTRHSR